MAQYDTTLGFKVNAQALKDAEKTLQDVQKSLKDVSKGASDMDKKTTTASKNMRRAFNIVKVSAAAASVALAGVVTSVVALAINNSKAIDSLGKMAQQIGTTTENLSNMRYAANMMAGVAEGRFDMALRRMTRRIQEAAAGGGPAAKAIEAMGLSAKELARLAPDEQFRKIADGIKATSAQGDRLRYVMALMDTEGMPLVNMLAEGSDKIREFEREAEKLGLTISGDTAKAAAEFQDTLSRLRAVKQGMVNDLTSAVLPSLNNLAEVFKDEETRDGIRQMTQWIAELTAKLIEGAVQIVRFINEANKLKTLNQQVARGATPDQFTDMQAQQRWEQIDTRRRALAQSPLANSASGRRQLAREADYGFRESTGITNQLAFQRVYDPDAELRYLDQELLKFERRVAEGLAESAKNAVNAATSTPVTIPTSPTSPTGSSTPKTDPLQSAYAAEVNMLTEQIALFGEIDNRTRMLWETEQGRFRDLDAAQKQHLLNLAGAKDSQNEAMAIEAARTAGTQAHADILQKVQINEEALELVRTGQIKTQEGLNRHLEREAFIRNLNKQIQEDQVILTTEQYNEAIAGFERLQELGPETEKAFAKPLVNIQEMFQDTLINNVGTAFERLFDGVEVGFSDMLKEMAKQAAKSMLMNYLTAGFGGASNAWSWSSMFGVKQADGGAWNKGVQFFANGGIVNRATAFGMAGGGMGVMGEAGPEAILPLTRGSNGKLGVAAEGSGGATLVVSPGAVVVNATEDSGEDVRQTAQALDQLINAKMEKFMREQQRPGNSLNRISGRF